MTFKQHLKKILEGLNRKTFCEMTGVPASSLSIWLTSDVEPSDERKRQIAETLGLDSDFFGVLKDEPVQPSAGGFTPLDASRLMGVGVQFIYAGLQQGVFPWGYAVNRNGSWSYWINRNKFLLTEGFKDVRETESDRNSEQDGAVR